MKIKLFIAFLLLAATATAQTPPVASMDELDDRGDIFYWKDTDDLFTGRIDDKTSSTDDYMSIEIVEGVANGLFRGYYDAERTLLKWEVPYVDGKKHGEYTYYFEDGSISFVVTCLCDKMEGERICYHEGGGLWHIHHYLHDQEHGVMQTWYTNGQKDETVHYRHGLKDGAYIQYNPLGVLHQKGQFKNDEMTGRWREWDDAGNLKADVTYKNGAEVKRKR